MLCREGSHASKCLVQSRSIRMIQYVGLRLCSTCDVGRPKQFVAESGGMIERKSEALAVQDVGVRSLWAHTGSTQQELTFGKPLQQGFPPNHRRQTEQRRDQGSVERPT